VGRREHISHGISFMREEAADLSQKKKEDLEEESFFTYLLQEERGRKNKAPAESYSSCRKKGKD